MQQDKKKSWYKLTLEEQLNTECNCLVKEMVKLLLGFLKRTQTEQFLLREPAALEVGGKGKQVTQLRQ